MEKGTAPVGLKQGELKDARDRIQRENREIQKRRAEREAKLIKERETEGESTTRGRAIRRIGAGGMPRSVIFAQKMAIPKERR